LFKPAQFYPEILGGFPLLYGAALSTYFILIIIFAINHWGFGVLGFWGFGGMLIVSGFNVNCIQLIHVLLNTLPLTLLDGLKLGVLGFWGFGVLGRLWPKLAP